MIFGRPDWFWWSAAGTLLVFCALAWTLVAGRVWIRARGGREKLIRQGSRIPRLIRDLSWMSLYVAGMAALALALMQPLGKKYALSPVYDAAVVVFLLDVSRSCLAEDVMDEQGRAISRCTFEKLVVRQLAPHLKDDLVGMIIFAKSAIVLEPMLLAGDEQELLYSSLRFIDEYFIEYFMPQGSNIAAAIFKAIQLSEGTAKKKVFLFLSDGENTEDETKTRESFRLARISLEDFRAQGQKVVFLLAGVGNPEGAGAPMPRRGPDGKIIGCYEDMEAVEPGEDARCKLTRPDPQFLSGAAQFFDGAYIHLKRPADIEELLLPFLSSARDIIGWKQEEVTADYSFWLAIFAFAMFFIAPIFKVP